MIKPLQRKVPMRTPTGNKLLRPICNKIKKFEKKVLDHILHVVNYIKCAQCTFSTVYSGPNLTVITLPAFSRSLQLTGPKLMFLQWIGSKIQDSELENNSTTFRTCFIVECIISFKISKHTI